MRSHPFAMEGGPPEIVCIYHVLIIATSKVLSTDGAQYRLANLRGGAHGRLESWRPGVVKSGD